jgi:hypothetical protein
MIKNVWVFNGAESRFPGGIFLQKVSAENWIKKNKLSGILTLYPVDNGVYDWAIENDIFLPIKEHHFTPSFIQGFTSASMEHYHYENGEEE